jgi:hypothetical protein
LAGLEKSFTTPLAGLTLVPVIAIVGVNCARYDHAGASTKMFVPLMVPFAPEIVNCVMSFEVLQLPSGVHAPHAENVPLSHVRTCVPQVHGWLVGPTHAHASH